MKPAARRETRQLVILTGLSGSGKSTVLKAFEDMGFYCVDNLPVELIPIFAELHAAGEGDFARAALLVDAREGTAKRAARIRSGRTSPSVRACARNAR